MIDFSKIPSPCYVLDEALLRRNLEVIRRVQERSGARIIMALKACAMWSVFPIVKEYIGDATASSVAEARLVSEELGSRPHVYAPVYTDADFGEILKYASHITFNTRGQYERFRGRVAGTGVSCGLRINPEYSPVGTGLYNPCCKGSRLGVITDDLGELPEGIEGLHFHTLCESGPDDLKHTLEIVGQKFGRYFPQLKWINMGGGHLMTHVEYDTEKLISVLSAFRARHPHLELILEPGSAFTWRTGYLVSTVEDIVCNNGVQTAMLDVSFACHMPDCLEMPYKPAVVGARDAQPGEPGWRLGGNSCLAGDYCGDWVFEHEPQVGDRVVFEDMVHYTMVKTTMFNGVAHPSIAIWGRDGRLRVVRRFGYEDYKARMS
ncbi:MAG: carboxynorspermidine decarboxylase [Rikenellaceae bacterium]|nr:carboxynorspermidine decarboxylase [Rikenellaceae bacterium]